MSISGCDIGWYSIRDVCYFFGDENLGPDAAQTTCVQKGGRLWEPKNGADYHAVFSVVKDVIKKFTELITTAFSAQMNDNLNFYKIKDKNVNFLVINNISKNNIGSNFNQVSIINHEQLINTSETLNKNYIASFIIDNTIG